MGTFYAKTKGLPESLYFLYCAAIIDAILELCPVSKDLHLRIVNQWDKPGCQSVITLLEKKLARCHDRNQYFIVLGMALIEAEIPDNEDWKCVCTAGYPYPFRHWSNWRFQRHSKMLFCKARTNI